jgi:hypothetical protein
MIEFMEYDLNRNIFGIIINLDDPLLGFISSRHWIGIMKKDNIYINMDSKIDLPKVYDNINELQQFLKNCITEFQGQIFIIECKVIE